MLILDGGDTMFKSRLPALVARKSERDQRKYTQVEISKAAQLRQPTISAWMNYSRRFNRIDAGVVAPLAEWLGCDPCDLFEYTND